MVVGAKLDLKRMSTVMIKSRNPNEGQQLLLYQIIRYTNWLWLSKRLCIYYTTQFDHSFFFPSSTISSTRKEHGVSQESFTWIVFKSNVVHCLTINSIFLLVAVILRLNFRRVLKFLSIHTKSYHPFVPATELFKSEMKKSIHPSIYICANMVLISFSFLYTKVSTDN